MGRIALNHVTKTFNDGQIVAVDDLSVDIADGEFLVLVGPSGCGKSTTLRMVAGLEAVSDGDITIGDVRVNDLDPRERNIAMVFQNYALYPHMTVRENIGFGLKLSTDLSTSEIRERVDEATEMMGISDLLDDKPKELSGGQQQRVALGRASVREPDAFLFDEPLSNLDAKLRTHMRTEITRIQNELDVTSVYVTHDQAEAMTMGDRIAIMNDGVLQQIGTPNEVYDHPENRFAAGFIGSPSMNFLEATYRETDDRPTLVARDENATFSYPLDDRLAGDTGLTDGTALTVGVRPEDVRLAEEEGGSAIQTGTVDVVEPMGSDNFVHINTGTGVWTARVDSDRHPEQGSTAEYTFDSSSVYLFDEDGRTIKSKGNAIRRTSGTEGVTA